MNTKYKWIAIGELIIIIALAFIIINSQTAEKQKEKNSRIEDNNQGLLSQRVYSQLIKPRSLLIINFEPLKEVFTKYIKEKTQNNGSISVYIENLRDGGSLGINERKGYDPASLNKLPTAMMILHKIEKGELSVDTMIRVDDEDRSNVFGDLYKTDKKELPLKIVLEKMLKESDNTAFNMLRKKIDKEDLDFFLQYSGYYNKDVLDQGDRKIELINTRSMYNLFSSLYLSTLLDADNSEYILSLLTTTVFDIREFADLPKEVVISQKFGMLYLNNKRYFHSCGIMYVKESRIFYCIMTENLSEKEGKEVIGTMIKTIYQYINKVKIQLDTYKETELS
ncbi:serine hydrolase [Candidatus Woesearchaeota archaeon]|nr:serine hydrolase [Candidatus Woesearchaeota archaeon]